MGYFSGDNGVGFNYKSTEPDLTGFYRHVAQETDVRVLIYNGDADPGLNSFRGENFTRGIGLTEKEGWRPWTIDGQMLIVQIHNYHLRFVDSCQDCQASAGRCSVPFH